MSRGSFCRKIDEVTPFSRIPQHPNPSNRCVLCTVYCVLCTVYCVLCTVYCVLCTVYCVLCTVYCVLCTVYCVLCTVYCVLCTVYCVLCTVYCVLCTVYCVAVGIWASCFVENYRFSSRESPLQLKMTRKHKKSVEGSVFSTYLTTENRARTCDNSAIMCDNCAIIFRQTRVVR